MRILSLILCLTSFSALAYPGQPRQIKVFASLGDLYTVELPNIDESVLEAPEEKCTQTCIQRLKVKAGMRAIEIGNNSYIVEAFSGYFDSNSRLVVGEKYPNQIRVREEQTGTHAFISLNPGDIICVGTRQRLCSRFSIESTY